MAYDGTVKIGTEIDKIGAEKGLKSLGGIAGTAAKAVTTAFAAVGTAVAGASIKAGIEFESAFAGVVKTVNATQAELAELEQGIRDMAKEIPIAATEIAGIAEAAGQLGIANENILSFTETMANLGVATNMTAEQAATSLARLANITQMPQENFDRLGATIVDLGNNFATTEAEITDMALRISGAGAQVGLTEAEILSFSAALSSLGISSEAGGTAISTLMSNMALAAQQGGDALAGFAEVAGVSADTFANEFKTNAAGAIESFILGLGSLEERGGSAIAVLDEMGLSDIRMRDALLRAAGAGTLFGDAIALGNTAWDENIALTNEASKRYDTMESRLKLLGNAATDFGVSFYKIMEGNFKDAVKTATGAINGLHENLPAIVKTMKAMVPIVVAVGTGLAAWKIGMILSDARRQFLVTSTALKMFSTVQKAVSLEQAALNGTMSAYQVVVGVLTGKITLATAAQAAWNVVQAANPIGVVLVAVTALAAGMTALYFATHKESEELQAFSEQADDLKDTQKEFSETVQSSAAAFSDNAANIESNAIAAQNMIDKIKRLSAENDGSLQSQLRLKTAVESLNEVMPELNVYYDEQTGTVKGLNDELDEQLKLVVETAKAELYRERVTELAKQQAEAELKLKQAIELKDKIEASGNATRTATVQTMEGVDAQLEYETDAYRDAAESVEYYQNQFDSLGAEIDTYIDAAAAVPSVTEDSAAAIRNLAAEYGVAESEIQAFVDSGGSLETWAAQQDAAVAQVEEILNRLVDAYYNMNEEIKAEDERSLADRINTIQNNQAAVDAYAANLDAIAATAKEKGITINDKLWEELQKGTPESMDLATDILDSMELDDGQWQTLNDSFSAGMEGALAGVGDNIRTGEGENPAQDILDDWVLTLESDTSVDPAMEGVVEGALNAAKSRVESIDFSQIGTNMMKGIENGIRNGTAGILSSIRDAVNKAHEAAKDIDDQNSPSKWWEKFGLNDMKGFAIGIDSGAKLVQQAQADMVQNLHRQMVPVYASEGVSPGYGSNVNNYNMTLYTHDSLSPFEQTQEYQAMIKRGEWQLQ